MVTINIKELMNDFENRLKALKIDTANLEKKKANCEADVLRLKSELTKLEKAVKDKTQYLVNAVTQAVAGATEKLKVTQGEVESQKADLAIKNAKRGQLNSELENKIKENERLRRNLEASIKSNEDLNKDSQGEKVKLEGIVRLIKEAL